MIKRVVGKTSRQTGRKSDLQNKYHKDKQPKPNNTQDNQLKPNNTHLPNQPIETSTMSDRHQANTQTTTQQSLNSPRVLESSDKLRCPFHVTQPNGPLSCSAHVISNAILQCSTRIYCSNKCKLNTVHVTLWGMSIVVSDKSVSAKFCMS